MPNLPVAPPPVVVIVNRGACPRRAIELIGFGTKDPSDVTQIGRFGSGTAYAVALALRQGLRVTLRSHDAEGPYTVEPYCKDVVVGGRTARQIMWRYHRGSSVFRTWWDTAAKALSRAWSVPTSFSLDLGARDWQGTFPVVREFVSNARDADPAHFRVELSEDFLESYLEAAIRDGVEAVTVVTIEGDAGGDSPDRYVREWSDHFRFGISAFPDDPFNRFGISARSSTHDQGSPFYTRYQSGLVGVFAKLEGPSPLKLYVRGVRCPWPSTEVPTSLFDYSLNLDLTEARTIKDQWGAAGAMTHLWNEVARGDRKLFMDMLRGVTTEAGAACWEATCINEYAACTWGTERPVQIAWRAVHGEAPVAGPGDPEVLGAVRVPAPMREYLQRSGVPTSVSRTVTTTVREGQPSAVIVPEAEESVVVEMTMEEASVLLALLAQEGVLPNLASRLVGAGVRARERVGEESDPDEESDSGETPSEYAHGGGVVLPEEPECEPAADDSIPF